jgi:outer membrane immunogenic protein
MKRNSPGGLNERPCGPYHARGGLNDCQLALFYFSPLLGIFAEKLKYLFIAFTLLISFAQLAVADDNTRHDAVNKAAVHKAKSVVAGPGVKPPPFKPRSPTVYAGPGIKPPPFLDWSGAYLTGKLGLGISPLNGGIAGIGAGTNSQFGSIVIGIEAEIDGSNLRMMISPCSGGGTCDFRDRWSGIVQGRLGYALDRFLPFVTAGLTLGNINTSFNDISTGSITKAGISIGGGIEVDLGSRWSARGEYRYQDFGHIPCGTPCGAASNDLHVYDNVVLFGLSYRFAPGPMPPTPKETGRP